MTMDPYRRLPQFMVTGVTGVAGGKKQNTERMERKQSAAMLMYIPDFPSVQRRAGSAPPLMRFKTRQLMHMTYEVKMLTPLREKRAFSAADEPMLTRGRRQLTRREMRMALSGIARRMLT